MTTIDQHIAKIRIIGEWCCWKLDTKQTSYTNISLNGKDVRGHRAVYEHFIKPIPSGLTLDHLCRNHWCCNPNHLEPVTHHVNVLRGASKSAINARKTTCKYGHEFSFENTYVRKPSTKAGRECKACHVRRLRKSGVKPRRQIPVSEIKRLRGCGWTVRKIERKLHVSRKTVIRFIEPTRKRGGFSRVET